MRVLRPRRGLVLDLYRPASGVLFPNAHVVADSAPPHVRHLYAVPSIAKFQADLEFLCRNYRPLAMSELEELPRRRGSMASARAFVLTFDDGAREVYDVIAPILRAKGVPAIFFLNSATVDNRQLMWRNKLSLLVEQCYQQPDRIPPQLGLQPGESLPERLLGLRSADDPAIDELARFFEVDFDDYLRQAQPYLTSDQVKELARDGFEIGAHSHSHPFFQELTVEQQKHEIATSVQFVRALGVPCRCFAFPFDDGGVPATAFEYQTELGVALSFGTSPTRRDSVPFSFHRFQIDGDNAHVGIPEILRGLSGRSLARRLSRTELIRRN